MLWLSCSCEYKLSSTNETVSGRLPVDHGNGRVTERPSSRAPDMFRTQCRSSVFDYRDGPSVHSILISAMQLSFDPPTVLPAPTVSVHPRPFVPLQQHPEPSSYPALPSPLRQPSFADLYTLTTHIIPAAYPRITADIAPPERISDSITDKAERQKIVAQKTSELLARKQQQPAVNAGKGSEKLLWNCVNRYVKKDLNSPKGLTLFFAHANGFPKEVCA